MSATDLATRYADVPNLADLIEAAAAVEKIHRAMMAFTSTGVADTEGFVAVATYVEETVLGNMPAALTFKTLQGYSSTPAARRKEAVAAIRAAIEGALPAIAKWEESANGEAFVWDAVRWGF